MTPRNDDDVWRSGGFNYDPEQSAAWLDALIKRLRIAPGSLLDAGCGDGFWTQLWSERGHACLGVDRNPIAIESARARCPSAAFFVADLALPMPALDHGYDLVFARHVPHFYRPDLYPNSEDVARNLLAHVRSNGALLLVVREMPTTLPTNVSRAGGRIVRHLRDEPEEILYVRQLRRRVR